MYAVARTAERTSDPLSTWPQRRDRHWMFPDAAEHEDIDSLAAALSKERPTLFRPRQRLEGLATADSAIDAQEIMRECRYE